MAETKIKICGLWRPEDILAVNEAMPDYAGFVFAKSPRQVTVSQAHMLRSRLNPGICPVGVFVDEDPKKVTELLKSGMIDMAQLHGREPAEEVRWIREQSGRPVMKAMVLKTPDDVVELFSYPADYFLADGGKGEGRPFNWSLLPKGGNLFLAGGINKDNVLEAIRQFQPYGVDVSSGVETNGRKDREKIIEITQLVRKGRIET